MASNTYPCGWWRWCCPVHLSRSWCNRRSSCCRRLARYRYFAPTARWRWSEPSGLPDRGRSSVRHAADVRVTGAGRTLAHRQEDRRIERQAVVIQIQHARGEDGAVARRLLNAVIAVDAAIVGIRVAAARADMRAVRVIAIGAEISRRRHHRRQRVVVTRLEFDTRPLRENIVVGGVEAADAAEEDERAVGRHHLDSRGVERLRRDDAAEIVGDLEQAVLVVDDAVEIDVGRA